MISDHLTTDLSTSPMGSITNGFTGIAASTLALITSFQEQLDWWVRFSGSVILLAISIISLYNMVSQLITKWRKRNNPTDK
jgi:hypothetical protein